MRGVPMTACVCRAAPSGVGHRRWAADVREAGPIGASTMTYRKSVRKQPCCSIRRRDWAATALTPRDERSEELHGTRVMVKRRAVETRAKSAVETRVEGHDVAIVGVGDRRRSIPEFAGRSTSRERCSLRRSPLGERRDAADKSSVAARHLAPVGGQGGRHQGVVGFTLCAASRAAREGIHRDIEVVTDVWGRPRCG